MGSEMCIRDSIDSDQGKHVMALEPVEGKKGVYELKKIPVKTELENDVNVVITGKELKDHLKILNDPEEMTEGNRVMVSDKLKSDEAASDEDGSSSL